MCIKVTYGGRDIDMKMKPNLLVLSLAITKFLIINETYAHQLAYMQIFMKFFAISFTRINYY